MYFKTKKESFFFFSIGSTTFIVYDEHITIIHIHCSLLPRSSFLTLWRNTSFMKNFWSWLLWSICYKNMLCICIILTNHIILIGLFVASLITWEKRSHQLNCAISLHFHFSYVGIEISLCWWTSIVILLPLFLILRMFP